MIVRIPNSEPIKLFLLLFLLGIISPGLYAAGTQAPDTTKGVLLYTPYVKISVPPGESIDYSIDVINSTGEVVTAGILLEGMPRSWDTEIKCGGWIVNQLAVLPGEKKNFSLKVEVPQKVNKGTYNFKVLAKGLAELPLSVTVSEQGTYQTEFTTKQPNMQGNSKTNFQFNASLRNRTAEQQVYALTADAPRGWNVVFKVAGRQVSSAQVEPGATETISIEMTPPATVSTGAYKIPVKAATLQTASEIELEAVITGSYQLELTTPRGLLSRDITAGETKRLDLVVKNEGSGELKDIQLSSGRLADWEVTFEPATLERLNAGESANAKATVKASKKALPGDYVIKMEAKNPEANASAEFRMTVKTPALWGWLGLLIIVAVLGGLFWLFRKYGRR
ncbi:MAG: NEW3 domain-containing protein [Tannerellaceae bacterium]|nr:NEW3 domain-containing protein [Tannerellaceae bacterium]